MAIIFIKEGGSMSPLRFITVTELKARATTIVREIERGKKQVVITKNGKPVAVMGPAPEEKFSFKK